MTPTISKILNFIVGFCFIASTLAACGTKAQEEAPSAVDSADQIEVKFYNLTIDPATRQPVVMLSDFDENRAILIWIGIFEARAIHSEIQGIEPLRPLTHDLLKSIIKETDGNIERIIITHVEENVFYATIVIQQNGSMKEIDARPSDSIVMALKFKAPIFVSKKLFDKMAISISDQKEIEEIYGITVQTLSPELAKYMSYESGKGVLISNVETGSAAEKDGLKAGDILLEIGNEAVRDVISMRNTMAKSESTVEAKIFRKKQHLTIELHLK